MDLWNSEVITFDPKVIDESTRVIEGIATAPVYDRVNELITADAIRKALPNYMKLPVVTVLHRDYAVGHTQEAKVLDDGSLFVRIKLKDTPDVDKVWSLIKSGELNSFSISGSRTETTCTVMGQPCVTNGINLSTITICGNDAANPKAKISYIQKTLFGEDNMVEEITDNVVEKTETTPDFSPILAAVAELQKTVDGLVEKTATPVVQEQVEVVDSAFEKSISDLTMSIAALNEKFTGFEQRLASIEEQKVEKGGILMNEAGEPKAVGNIKIEDYIMNRYPHGS